VSATARPVSLATCNLVTVNIPAGAPFGTLLLGF
jgi:hypothetical protein